MTSKYPWQLSEGRPVNTNCVDKNYRILKGGGPRGGGNWGTLRIPREDWGTLGNIRED